MAISVLKASLSEMRLTVVESTFSQRVNIVVLLVSAAGPLEFASSSSQFVFHFIVLYSIVNCAFNFTLLVAFFPVYHF